jgi:hypothetical protein
MLPVDRPGADLLREQISQLRAADFPDGRPSIYLSEQRRGCMRHYSSGAVIGGDDGIVLRTAGDPDRLYALEWFGSEDDGPEEFPPASRLRVTPAG